MYGNLKGTDLKYQFFSPAAEGVCHKLKVFNLFIKAIKQFLMVLTEVILIESTMMMFDMKFDLDAKGCKRKNWNGDTIYIGLRREEGMRDWKG